MVLKMLDVYFTFTIIELFHVIRLLAAVQCPVASAIGTAAMQRAADYRLQNFAAARSADQNIYFPLPRQAPAPGHGMRSQIISLETNRNRFSQQSSQG